MTIAMINTVDTANNLKWQTNSFTENALPICNNCDWTRLSKYILLRWGQENWYASEIACNTNFGTNLASIHTNADEEEAKYVHTRICIYLQINGDSVFDNVPF